MSSKKKRGGFFSRLLNKKSNEDIDKSSVVKNVEQSSVIKETKNEYVPEKVVIGGSTQEDIEEKVENSLSKDIGISSEEIDEKAIVVDVKDEGSFIESDFDGSSSGEASVEASFDGSDFDSIDLDDAESLEASILSSMGVEKDESNVELSFDSAVSSVDKEHTTPKFDDIPDDEKKTILIVEDEVITAMDLKYTLTDLGYKVVATVDNGQDAIDTAAELCPDITIMDINLKGEMSGIEAAEKILEFDLPVIYLTANTDDATFSKAVGNSSAYAFIPKPFNAKIIKHNIDFAINRAGIESEKINLAHGFVEK